MYGVILFFPHAHKKTQLSVLFRCTDIGSILANDTTRLKCLHHYSQIDPVFIAVLYLKRRSKQNNKLFSPERKDRQIYKITFPV